MQSSYPGIEEKLMIRLRSLAVALAAFTAAVHAQAPATHPPVPGAPTGVTAFVDVAVVPMDTERVLTGQTVLVQGGRITTLGPSNKVRVPAGAALIDGRGQYLIPGLADMHVHFRGARDSATLERWLVRWLADGVTTVRNMDRHREQDGLRALQLKARAAAGELLSPRIYTAGPWAPEAYRMSGTVDPRTKQPKHIPPRLDSVAAYVTAYQAAGYDFIKPYHESPAVLDSLTAAARRVRIPVAGHVPSGEHGVNAVTLEQALRAGYASIEHLMGYDAFWRGLFSGGSVPPFDTSTARIRALATATQRAGVWNCPTQWMNGADTTVVANRVMRSFRHRLIKALQDAGAGLLLGTDAVDAEDPGGLVYREFHALVAAGLTPYQALAAGTRNAAEYFGTLDESGTIAVGKRADLVLLAGNPLIDINDMTRPAGVMLGGRWLVRAELDRRLAELGKRP
jgi:imidazolonepropionase-like amidohydrolase